MELRYLRSFVEVAERGHVGRAARALRLAQPSLSHHLARLESELGASLFERTHAGMRTTPAGRLLLAEVRPLLQRIDDLARRVRETGLGERGTIAIGFVPGAVLGGGVSHAVRAFRRAYPNVAVAVRAAPQPVLIEALREGAIDVAIFGEAPNAREFGSIPFGEERFVAIVPAGHALSKARRIAYRDLAGETLVALSREAGPGLFAHTIAVCRKHGFAIEGIEETAGEEAVIGLVAAGAGVAVVPETWARIKVPGATSRPLSPAGESMELRLHTRSGSREAAVRAFVTLARGLARERAAR